MAALSSTNGTGQGAFTITEITLGSSDTITYDATKKQFLHLRNPTGSTVTPVIDGDGSTTASIDGIGSVDLTGGYPIAIPAGATKGVVLSTVRNFCLGVVAIKSGTGVVASLTNL